MLMALFQLGMTMMISSHMLMTVVATDVSPETATTTTAAATEECGLYLAISSTSTVDDTNWGLFVGQDIDGLNRPIGNPEIGIVVSNLRLHNEGIKHAKTDLIALVDYFEAFFWVPSTVGAKYHSDTTKGERAIAAISGAGVLASYSKHMTNSDWDPRAAYTRTAPEEVSQLAHPNRGAISTYHNCQIRTTVNRIKTGSEVFMEYGETWAEKEDDEDALTKDDYIKMDETLAQMIVFFSKYNSTVLDDDSRLEIYSFLMKDIMKAAVGPTKARRIAAILPPNPNDLGLVPAAGGILAYSDPTAHRSLSFLQKYGLCMDHIYAAPSTIPNIGRGAFARRDIRVGNLVVPIPLTHVTDKAIFNMYPLTTDAESGNFVRESDTTVLTQQLIVNYCFGHPETTMLFFPSGSMTTLINHSKEPNAKLQWSTHPNHQKLWYNFDPHTTLMEEEYMYMGLILEVVALRDIAPDEEIFIDYGPEWQKAYDDHVQAWNQKLESGVIPKVWPVRAIDLNTKYHHPSSNGAALTPFPTKDEASFPENIMLAAFLMLKDTENEGTIDDPKLWNTDDPMSAYATDHLFEIQIIGRTDITVNNTYSYTVEWKSRKSEDSDENTSKIHVANVPHEAITFVDRPNRNDQQFLHEHSFRHYIGIPDEIFPKGPWRNVVVASK